MRINFLFFIKVCTVASFIFGCRTDNSNKIQMRKTGNLKSEIGPLSDSVNFYKQVLLLEDLSSLEDELMAIHSAHDNVGLKIFLRKTIDSLNQEEQADYIQEVIENCEDLLLDIESRKKYEFPDLYSTWAELRLIYASAVPISSITKESEFVTLSSENAMGLLTYHSPLILEAQQDENFDIIFGYEILGEENGKTKIALYELEYD